MGRTLTMLLNLSDRFGLRPLVALAASATYGVRSGGRQRFRVDDAGRWANIQPEATIVSPAFHTAAFNAFEAIAIDQWAFSYVPRAGDTVIDVGAGIGEETVIFSRLVGSGGRVISIEAHPATFNCLRETVRRTGLDNVTLLCVAVSDVDGTATITETDSHIGNSIVAGEGQLNVPARSLDSLAEELELGTVDLLKMNIEGAEKLAVQGMERLSKRVKHVVISCHDFISDRTGDPRFRTFDDVRQWLTKGGFDIVTRPEHTNAWTRYYIYGRNKAFD